MKIRPVLLVEDDDNDVLFLRTAWKKASVPNSLAVVTDGEKALDYLAGAGQYLDREAHPYPCLLLLDLNRGIELRQARASSVAVLVVSLALTAVFGARLW